MEHWEWKGADGGRWGTGSEREQMEVGQEAGRRVTVVEGVRKQGDVSGTAGGKWSEGCGEGLVQ